MTITWRRTAVFVLVAGAVALALVADWIIVTEREKISATIDALRASMSAADAEAVFQHISRDYDGEDLSREALRAIAEAVFDRHGAIDIRTTTSGINRMEDMAAVNLGVLARSERGGLSGYSEWALTLRKEADGSWRVTRLAPVKLGRRYVAGWRDIVTDSGL